MRAVGVICEYNPFHNGHAYQLSQARKAAGADAVVCVMSGCFTQRGEAALLDPWTRAGMALAGGADVVLELPTLYAVRNAQQFALGGVSILHRLGVPALSFGCEIGDAQALMALASALGDDAAYQAALRRLLSRGLSFPAARSQALLESTGQHMPNLPNLSLALEYIQAIQTLESPMEVFPILRKGQGHHSRFLTQTSSATAIRKAVAARELEGVQKSMPEPCYLTLAACLRAGRYVPEQALDLAYLYAMRRMHPAVFERLLDVNEGLEHRFVRAAQTSSTLPQMLGAVKTKRYPFARLSRIATYALLDMDKTLAQAHPLPPYARLLGFRKSAGPLLRRFQKTGELPILTHGADRRFRSHPVFALDVRAQDVWALGIENPALRTGDRSFTQAPVVVKEG